MRGLVADGRGGGGDGVDVGVDEARGLDQRVDVQATVLLEFSAPTDVIVYLSWA